jgi:hypothetical protein
MLRRTLSSRYWHGLCIKERRCTISEKDFTVKQGGPMKQYVKMVTTAAVLTGFWLPGQAQTSSPNTAAVQDSGEKTETAAVANAMQSTGVQTTPVVSVGTRDTVYVMEKGHGHSFWKEQGARHLWREKGYGVCGGFTPSVMAIDCRPVKYLLANLPAMNANGFSFGRLNYQPIYVSGGIGYLGVGNGVRIGGAGLSGEKNVFGGGAGYNSTGTLRLHVEYGGFLVEKAFVRHNANYLLGGSIGSGTLTVHARNGQVLATQNEDDHPYSSVTAKFLLVEAHGGVTYSILSWLHMGADVSVPFFYAADGFQGYTPSFVTVNPVFRARVMLGNLG